jgi:glycosyl transferase family 1
MLSSLHGLMEPSNVEARAPVHAIFCLRTEVSDVRLIFVHWAVEDRGSAQDMYHYATVAKKLGHEIALYGRPPSASAFNYSLDIESADAAIFLNEWTTELQFGDRLDFVRLLSRMPRQRRVIVDLDGKYNDVTKVVGDYNHPDSAASRRWIEVCDSITDKIYQATLRPLRPNVRSFLFHAYSPTWELSLDFTGKEYGMYCVGNNWFRWRPMSRVLKAIEPVRQQVGRIGLAGAGWDTLAPWANPSLTVDAYYSDQQYLAKLGVEVMPAVHFRQVIEGMSKGVFTPVIYRPLFDHLQMVTCRTFETPAANAIPLFTQSPEYVEAIFGEDALELILPNERPHEKILDILSEPERYAPTVMAIRRRLAESHSYEVRLRELINIVQS